MPTVIPRLVRRGESDLSTSTISRHVLAGRLITVLPGVYLRADVANDLYWRANAVAAWRPSAVLVGRFAATLTFWPELSADVLEFACESTARRPGLTFSRRAVPTEWVTSRGQLQILHPAVAALDLATILGGDAIDRALRSRRVGIDDLHAALAATPSRRGNVARRRLLLESRAEPWSAAERLAHRLLREAGITSWRATVPVQVRGRQYFLDIAFEAIMLAIEIDGREVHSRPEIFESDRVRHNALAASAWTVLHFTYHQLERDPAYVVATTRAGIAAARRRLSG